MANLGNLIHRVLQFIYKHFETKIPKINTDKLNEFDLEFIYDVKSKYIKYREIMTKVEMREGLKMGMEISSRGNKYLQDSKFWEEDNKKNGRYPSFYAGPTSSSTSSPTSSASSPSSWNRSCLLAVPKSTSCWDSRRGRPGTMYSEES